MMRKLVYVAQNAIAGIFIMAVMAILVGIEPYRIMMGIIHGLGMALGLVIMVFLLTVVKVLYQTWKEKDGE